MYVIAFTLTHTVPVPTSLKQASETMLVHGMQQSH